MMDSLGDRMKGNYENAYRIYLTRRTPAIIRIDGKAFHSFTKGLNKPYDLIFKNAMWQTTQYLCENIQNARLGYVQSDEISILMIDYNKFTTSAWFDNNIQKICSVSASMATMAFNQFFAKEASAAFKCPGEHVQYPRYDSFALNDARPGEFLSYQKKFGCATFDSRVFNIPESEVCNYFIWRQQDATRNSIELLGRQYFSNKELHKVNCKQIQDKLFTEKDVNWNDCPTFFKRGVCVYKVKEEANWKIDLEIPIFTQKRDFIERHLEIEEK